MPEYAKQGLPPVASDALAPARLLPKLAEDCTVKSCVDGESLVRLITTNV